ncbi:Alpha/Beta hydrolase protein [Hygrophoropsis aurantiaca]|uniref:Alpha/Beta hydrolase protein n=1 Tax=Hygrophoropsis aurantiaca TaxID=72124 RepID=A0ACB8AUI5_9AGAM|nr:Alpha/Beta hydrolase protein [Hygrophoropsis aurantiaca]
MSNILASQPSECCWTGFKHTGTAVGREEELGGMNTYISEPPMDSKHSGSKDTKKVILYLSDVYGPTYLNNKLIQDYFASYGFIVLGPDYFFGTSVPNQPPGTDLRSWAAEAYVRAVETFPKWLEGVRERYGQVSDGTKYFAVGYCFGAPFVMDLAVSDDISAGSIVHPAMLEDSHFEKLKQPILLSCSEEDSTFPLESRRRAEDLMNANPSRPQYYFQVFSGVSHGFAVRGDPDIPIQRWAKEESARGIKDWFNWFAAL